MGSGKKKDKKKRKRHRSSSDEDGYDDYDKYSSKRKSDSYVVEDSRANKSTLQSIADNYGYERNDKKQKKKSKYDDIPETEEYVYDQFGEIVHTSRERSISPHLSGDEYDDKARNSKYEDRKNDKHKGPVTPPLPSSPKAKKERSYSKLDKNYTTDTNQDAAPILKNSKSDNRYDSISNANSRNEDIVNNTNQDDKIDYNSADYILKKIREQTKFKPTDSNYQSSNSPNINEQAKYLSSDLSYNSRNVPLDTNSNSNIRSQRGEYDDYAPQIIENAEYIKEEGEYIPPSRDSYVSEKRDSRHDSRRSQDEYNSTPGKVDNSTKQQTDEYGTVEIKDEYGTYTMDAKRKSQSPPHPANRTQSSQPLPPGVDQPYDDSEPIVSSRDKSKNYSKPKKEEQPAPPTSSTESLSIEETNKIRAKLGLKPLSVDSGSSEKTAEKSYAERSDVHAPPVNISEKKHEEKMRERMEAIREKRKINQKLRRVKGLGDEDDPVLDSAAAWVAKSRIQEKEKQMADKREQMLEEMDEEFGVTKIMSKSILKKDSKFNEYDRSNLHGLKVEHRASDISEADQTILTLKDKDVLDEDEDVLHNVNVRETELARVNLKNKKKGPGYKAYDEFDEETGEFKMRTVLDKYDEEIEGQKKESFRIKIDGRVDIEGENEMEKIRAILKSQQVSLATADMIPARDYYTSEEMVSFKKPGKKKRKVRKREILKADDLLKMELVDSNKDRGSRKLKSAMKNSNKVFDTEIDTSTDMDIVPTEVDELDYFVAVNQHMDEEPLLEDDEAERELQIALQRSRRAKLRTNNHGGIDGNTAIEKVANDVLSKSKANSEETEITSSKNKKKNKNAIVLDSTSEFCRTLGDIPTLSSVPNYETEEKNEDDMDIEEPESSTSTATKSGWEQVEISEDVPLAESQDDDDDDDVLEAEPIPTGLAATLNLANMKGYLKDGKEKVRKFDPLNLPETKAEVDVEKLRDEEKNKYTRGYERERDRDRYDPYAWKEKTNYKPDIKLEYVDNKGRQMNQKEAFRLLSHKFHGKGSGKLKTEKRSKKLLDEKKLQMMSSIDTPLNTAALFKDKQKQSQSAYLVLSGGGKNILSGETLKK